MATKTYKVLGQAMPTASNLVTLYSPTNAAQAVCSTLSICNQDVGSTKISVAVIPSGQTLTSANYIMKDFPFDGSDSDFVVIGLTLSPGDAVKVLSNNGAVSFSLFGEEIA